MTDLVRRKLVLGGALLGGAGLAGLLRPRQAGLAGAQQLIEAALPERLGAWRRIALGDFILPPADTLGRSLYDALILRGYSGPGDARVYCVVTYGAVQDYALQLHRPEVCYPASGFAIHALDTYPARIGGLDLGAEVMVAGRDDRAETVLYWTRVGQSFPGSQWQVRKTILGSLAHFRLPDGAMVRLSTQQLPGPATTAMLGGFADLLVRDLRGAGRAVLLGRAT
ncbi:MAG TPA: EpsI family protein [Novosphingobium sp.]